MKCSALFLLAAWLCMVASGLGAAGVSSGAYPLWDGKETVAHYAWRANLPATQTLGLGNNISLELVLIPAGKFIMGTPEPEPVNKDVFRVKIIVGQAVLAAGSGILLVLIAFSILRAIRERHRFQYSLRRFMAMMFAAGLCVLGGMHWWHSKRTLEDARAEYSAAMARYRDMDANFGEKPAHGVTITKPFYMGKFEVTQEQYQQVMGWNPSHFRGANLPVEKVSWYDAKEFCKKVGEKLPLTLPSPHGGEGKGVFRLPTEAEWEYACRAGTVTRYCSGDRVADLMRVAWFRANSGNRTHPVGGKEPNAWGLYDMHGNVGEWCEDLFRFYTKAAVTDPHGPVDKSAPVPRGGTWSYDAGGCRSAFRILSSPDSRRDEKGFRVVLAGAP